MKEVVIEAYPVGTKFTIGRAPYALEATVKAIEVQWAGGRPMLLYRTSWTEARGTYDATLMAEKVEPTAKGKKSVRITIQGAS